MPEKEGAERSNSPRFACFLCVCAGRWRTSLSLSACPSKRWQFCLQKTAPPADLTQSGPETARKAPRPARVKNRGAEATFRGFAPGILHYQRERREKSKTKNRPPRWGGPPRAAVLATQAEPQETFICTCSPLQGLHSKGIGAPRLRAVREQPALELSSADFSSTRARIEAPRVGK